jgi:uncharacterized membrane protein YfbV (UPF0208 family)
MRKLLIFVIPLLAAVYYVSTNPAFHQHNGHQRAITLGATAAIVLAAYGLLWAGWRALTHRSKPAQRQQSSGWTVR